ncbi:hypothetical protein PMG71_17935 [Roseofilum sp. BLCC_M154]|uniref:Uncharacterized protein n=1 Tax=Roseofilum acuticapitatum BLCC-M154 TaxID=3022444 RepID=A0ABT7AWM9_9CYAN|nr:hypothetical protein [Roseofilum acuticapitatum]MDJ1171313.1 hypothetical protein [Roseofilum acuticapitatum BLCC-M154]
MKQSHQFWKLLRRNPDIDIATTTVYVGANGRSPLQPCPILN